MATLKEYRRALQDMKWYKQIYWYHRIRSMDYSPFFCDSCFRILEPSYYYLHTPEECKAEAERRLSKLKGILREYESKHLCQG